jgi:hypothetical protein
VAEQVVSWEIRKLSVNDWFTVISSFFFLKISVKRGRLSGGRGLEDLRIRVNHGSRLKRI